LNRIIAQLQLSIDLSLFFDSNDNISNTGFQRPITYFNSNDNISNTGFQRPITYFNSNDNISNTGFQRPIMFYDSNDKIPDAAKVIGNGAGKLFLGHSKFY